MSDVLKLTAADFKEVPGTYYREYCGKVDLSTEFDGSVEIEGGLGWVYFPKLWVRKHITASAGSGIEAGSGIKAGEGIKAGWGIRAGSGIEAGEGIKAGSGIEAGWGIEAGSGILAGLSITCKKVLSFRFRLFAGVAVYKQTVTDEEKRVTCGRLDGGEVVYGQVVELGMGDAEAQPSVVNESAPAPFRRLVLDGTEYELHPVEVGQ